MALGTLLYGCDDQLDFRPAQSVDQELALNNDANVKSVLIGAYSVVRLNTLYGGRLQLFSEMLAANREVRWEGTFNQPREIFNKQMFTNNTFITNTWSDAYRAINITNNVLSAIDIVDEADRNRVQGEALFLRGSMYFELVKLYGLPYVAGNVSTNLGVPIVLQPTRAITPESFVERASVEAVYQQILSDLTTAENLLPNTNGFLASKFVAAAQLSRVYLQMERFADARDASNRAIEISTTAGKRLIANYLSAFNTESDSEEDLFAIQVNTQDPVNDMFLYYSLPEFGARGGDVAILNAHINQYEATDQRLEQFFFSAGEFRTSKWRDQFRNVKVIRLAEMYLTRAEANFREGTAVGATALADVNRIRARVGLPSLTVLTIENILRERRLELAHEGQTIHDIKRTRGSVLDSSADSNIIYSYDDPRMVFPIPQRDTDANPALVQNPGYGG